jgi:bacterioferritin-associated ferredoxin
MARRKALGVFVCNCNGIRERQVRSAIESGARRPVEVFEQYGCRPQCARCVRDIRRLIDATAQHKHQAAA